MPRGKRKRKLLMALGLMVAGLLLIWFAAPLWFPALRRRFAVSQGIHFARYEHVGYRRFALHEVTYTDPTIRVRADRLEAFVPTVWLWRWAIGRRDVGPPFASVSGWRVEFLSSSQTTTSSVYSTAQD